MNMEINSLKKLYYELRQEVEGSPIYQQEQARILHDKKAAAIEQIKAELKVNTVENNPLQGKRYLSDFTKVKISQKDTEGLKLRSMLQNFITTYPEEETPKNKVFESKDFAEFLIKCELLDKIGQQLKTAGIDVEDLYKTEPPKAQGEKPRITGLKI